MDTVRCGVIDTVVDHVGSGDGTTALPECSIRLEIPVQDAMLMGVVPQLFRHGCANLRRYQEALPEGRFRKSREANHGRRVTVSNSRPASKQHGGLLGLAYPWHSFRQSRLCWLQSSTAAMGRTCRRCSAPWSGSEQPRKRI